MGFSLLHIARTAEIVVWDKQQRIAAVYSRTQEPATADEQA